MADVLTRQREEHLPLAVLLSHRRRQVAGVPAAVGTGEVAQADAVGAVQQDERRPQIRVIVPVGLAAGELSGQEAAETRRRLPAEL